MARLLSVNVGLPRDIAWQGRRMVRRLNIDVGAVGCRPERVEAPVDGNVLICYSQPQGDIAIDL